jgi:hypothetical protein
MNLRERSRPASAALLLAAPALGLLAAGLALALERWHWAMVCVRICGPFLPADLPQREIEAFRRALDWHTPLALAAAAALAVLALWLGLRAGRRGPSR